MKQKLKLTRIHAIDAVSTLWHRCDDTAHFVTIANLDLSSDNPLALTKVTFLATGDIDICDIGSVITVECGPSRFAGLLREMEDDCAKTQRVETTRR